MLVTPRIAHHHHNAYLAVLTVDVSVPLKCQGATCVWQPAQSVRGKCNTLSVCRYESLSDVGEIRVYFASKILTPCRMH